MKYLLIILFILPLTTALLFLNKGLFHYDAIVLAEAVEKSYLTNTLQPAINGRYGAVVLTSIVYFPFWLFGMNADFATRLTAALFYAASIPVAYLFLNLLFHNKRTAIYAALIFAVHPVYLSPNTFGKEHGIAFFFVLLSFATLIYGLQKKHQRYLIISGIVLAISHTIREATLFFIPFYLLLLFVQQSKLSRTQRVLSTLIPYALCFALFTALYLAPILYKTIFPTQEGTAYTLLKWQLFINTVKVFLKTTPTFTLLLAISTLLLFNRWPTLFITLLGITSFIYFGTISTFAPRYLDITAFATSTLAAITLAKIPLRLIAHLFFIIIILSSAANIFPLLAQRHNYNGHIQAGKWLQENTPTNAVIITQDDAPFISYYGKRKTLGPPRSNHLATKKFAEDLTALISNGTPIYMTSTAFGEDPGDVNKNILPTYFDFKNNQSFLVEDFHNGEVKRQRYHQIIWELNIKNTTNFK